MIQRVCLCIAFGWTAVASGSSVPFDIDISAGELRFSRTYPVLPQPSMMMDVGGQAVASLAVSLDCEMESTVISLENFQTSHDGELAVHVPWGVLGSVDHGVIDPTISLDAGESMGVASPIDAFGAFDVEGTTADVSGTGDTHYEFPEDSILCFGFTTVGEIPCAGTLPLSEWTLHIESFSGNVERDGPHILIDGEIQVLGTVPELHVLNGEIQFAYTFSGIALMPLPELDALVESLVSPSAGAGAFCDTDVNGDGSIDGRDVQAYVDALFGG